MSETFKNGIIPKGGETRLHDERVLVHVDATPDAFFRWRKVLGPEYGRLLEVILYDYPDLTYPEDLRELCAWADGVGGELLQIEFGGSAEEWHRRTAAEHSPEMVKLDVVRAGIDALLRNTDLLLPRDYRSGLLELRSIVELGSEVPAPNVATSPAFDRYVVCGVREEPGGNMRAVESGETPDAWSLYGVSAADGLPEWLADFKTKTEAQTILRLLKNEEV